jgi:hypothetical protein
LDVTVSRVIRGSRQHGRRPVQSDDAKAGRRDDRRDTARAAPELEDWPELACGGPLLPPIRIAAAGQ